VEKSILREGMPSRVLHIVLGLSVVGCSSVSPLTEKSTVHLVHVAQDVEPRQTLVGQGNEVRWQNNLTESIVITFPASAVNRISCNTGFKTEEHIGLSAVVEPNASASLCFARQGKYNYQVRVNQRLDSALGNKRAILWVVGRGERNPDPYEEYTNITP
jgi:plastocyanin